MSVSAGDATWVASNDIDDYLAAIDEPKRSTLEAVRRMILEVVPNAEECMSYGVPAFKVRGKVVAGFAAFKHHLSYLPHSGSVFPVLRHELTDYRTSSGALRFAVDTPLPKDLIERLVRTRMDQLGIR
jgi:uncharacterized protein YdhG (YjbR/CyaY superfamily)